MAKRPCSRTGCPNLVPKGYCATCAPKYSSRAMAESRRPSAAMRGYGRPWQKMREVHLRMHPLCADIYGDHGVRVAPAVELDHIVPHKGDMEKFWDPANLQGLCKECHSKKTATEDSYFARYRDGRGAQAAADRLKDGRTY
jgi:5-methylcytosine-specific restriction protein A